MKTFFVSSGPEVTEPYDTHVYFFEAEQEGLIKIGISSDVTVRHAQIEAQTRYRLSIVAKSNAMMRSRAFSVEKMLHRYFEKQHVHGEFFKIKRSDIVRAAAELSEYSPTFPYEMLEGFHPASFDWEKPTSSAYIIGYARVGRLANKSAIADHLHRAGCNRAYIDSFGEWRQWRRCRLDLRQGDTLVWLRVRHDFSFNKIPMTHD